MTRARPILDRAGDALLALAVERPWPEVTLRAIAARAGVTLAEFYPLADSRLAVLAHVSQGLDKAALAIEVAEGQDPHDRLFDATMARIEAMAPHRAAIAAIVAAENPAFLAPLLPRTARAILEAAGLTATPPRLAAMTAVWGRTLQVWRDDEGALNRTMAEVDLRLKDMRRRLVWIRAGF